LVEKRRDDLVAQVLDVKHYWFNVKMYQHPQTPIVDLRKEVFGDLTEYLGHDEKVLLSNVSADALSSMVDPFQVFSGPMVQSLLGVGKKRSVKAQKVQEVVLQLLNIMAKDKDSEKIAQAWRRWRGESYAVSLQKATLAHAQNIRLKLKQWAQFLEERA